MGIITRVLRWIFLPVYLLVMGTITIFGLGVGTVMYGAFGSFAMLIVLAVVQSYFDMPKTHPYIDHLLHKFFWVIMGIGFLFGNLWLWKDALLSGGADDDAFGSARLAADKEVNRLKTPEGCIIGLHKGKRGKPALLRYNGPAHLMTIAPTRAGKGVSTIIPNLLTLDRSMLVVDPKGENAKITARARAKFGKVLIVDPFDTSGKGNAAYNPLAGLSPDNPDLIDDVNTLSDALIFDPPSQIKDAHWNEEAKALLSGLLLFCICHEEHQGRTLSTIREYLSFGPERFKGLIDLMTKSTEANGLIARSANRYRGKTEKEAASILSTAQRHTNFLDSPRIQKSVAKSNFKFSDLKESTTSIFLVLPPDRLDAYARWLRLLISQALTELARSKAKADKPVLFLLDEFAALGHLSSVERAMGLMAGYGVQLWPILQDIHQLRSTYGERTGSFFSNVDVLQTFGTKDFETASLLSKMLGQTTVSFKTFGESTSYGTSSSSGQQSSSGTNTTYSESSNTSLTGRSVLTPDEITSLDPHNIVLFVKGLYPIPASRPLYYDDPEFKGLFDPA